MPFVSAKDPRVPTVQNPKFGFDGSTPFDGQLVFPTFNSPVPVANYVDAQLILAESQLAANDAGWLATLNALRAGPTNIGAVTVTGMSALTDPGIGRRADRSALPRARVLDVRTRPATWAICGARSACITRPPRRFFPARAASIRERIRTMVPT